LFDFNYFIRLTDSEFQNKFPKLTTVWRRYTEFEQLRGYLEVTHPYIVLPPLPEKRVMFGWQKISSDTFDPNFVDRRRAGLENFLLRIASHPVLSWDKHFIEFLQHEDDWRESYKSNGMTETHDVCRRLKGCFHGGFTSVARPA
jgi:sorting nexin-4